MIEDKRHNKVSTRNQRLAALRTFYRYLAVHHPEMLSEAERVEAIPTKRTSPPETIYLERVQIETLFKARPDKAASHSAIEHFSCSCTTQGGRAQEIVDLRVGDIDLEPPLRARLHGKGDKWRKCPLWPETVELLKQLETVRSADKALPLLTSRQRRPLTRFGIYKIVKRNTVGLQPSTSQPNRRSVSPHSSSSSPEGVPSLVEGW